MQMRYIFTGGNTPALLKVLKDYSNLESLFSQKTVAGSSAGAYMLAKYGTAHTEESIREGLGIVNKKVVCHFQSPDKPPTESSLTELKKIAPKLETVYLKDCEWQCILK